MSSTAYDPIFKPIEYEVDLPARTARVHIPDILESTAQPIISPATGQPHRVRIDIPNGIEFEQAEIGSASTKVTGAIAFELKDSYGQFKRNPGEVTRAVVWCTKPLGACYRCTRTEEPSSWPGEPGLLV